MKSYRLVIRQQGRIVGHFDTTGEAALEDACVARSLFGRPVDISANCWSLTASGEFWSTPEGLRVLSREKCYRPVTCAV